jgi:hypothetical protein
MTKQATLLLAAGLALGAASLPAKAIMLCDCCAKDAGEACAKACENISKAFCRPVVVMDKTAKSKANPLNGINLKYLDLSDLTPLQREKVRKWAEKLRKKAEKDFRMTRLLILWGHKDKSAFAPAEKTRDQAVVNYDHIMRAYRAAARAAKATQGN